MRKKMQPFGDLLHPGPPQHAGPQWPGSDEHVFKSLMHDSKLVNRPEQPLQFRFRHQRRHAERPDLLGVEAEPSGKLDSRKSLCRCRIGGWRDRLDLHG